MRLAEHLVDHRGQLGNPARLQKQLPRASVVREGGQRLVDLVRDGPGHFAGGREAQGLLQAFVGALTLVHHDAQIERGQRKRGDQRLQLR